jgi:phosphohistidine phosphatase
MVTGNRPLGARQMLKLILMRHAKSSWTDKKLDDFDRPLSKRGREAAPLIGRELAKRGLIAERILCSPAKRTRQTLTFLAEGMAAKPAVSYEDRLYSFGDGSPYLETIAAQQKTSPLMVIGHNPSIQNLALRLIGANGGELISRIARKFPTAAVAVIDLPGDSWSQLKRLDEGTGKIETFLTPKMLKA